MHTKPLEGGGLSKPVDQAARLGCDICHFYGACIHFHS